MRAKLKGLFVIIGVLFGGFLIAQQKTISGTVTDENGFPIYDAVITAPSGQETYSDLDGNFSISVNAGDVITIEAMDKNLALITITDANVYNVQLTPSETVALEGVVITALGISRDERSLGYSSQEVDGDILAASRVSNPLNALSGNVAGVQITSPSSNLGGSTRLTIRGVTSLTGENRPLIVVDGVPMNNSNFNDTNTQRGAGGRDYGDMAFDINPDDIESINVLKGGPAAALYGSRGANGVIMITTKSARKGRDEIILNTGISVETISIFPRLQKIYGGGDGEFEVVNINGTDYEIVAFGVDESWGPKYDPNRLVLQWNAFDPEFASDYLTPTPWVYPKTDVEDFFRHGITYTNSISFGKSYENTMARFSLSNVNQSGIVPNSTLKRSTASLNLQNRFNDNFTASADINYVRTSGFNRPEVGYGDNSVIQKFFQWGQRQLDFAKLRDYKLSDGTQRTWNRTSWFDGTPAYSDNPYWTVYENTSKDLRNRFYGNVKLRYDFNENLYATTTIYGDTYSFDVNSHVAIGSAATSEYNYTKRGFTEMNYEGRLHFNKEFGRFSVNAFAGINRKDMNANLLSGSTSGGLIAPEIYNLGNSKETPIITEARTKSRTNSVFGQVSLGWDNLLFVDVTGRNDWSSTLPSHNNSYFYPSLSGSFVFSELIESSWLGFGKIRGGWSEVRHDADPYLLNNVFLASSLSSIFLETPTFTNESTRRNSDLKPELVTTWEVGLEARMFKNRFMFDVTYYEQETQDLIMPVQTSASTGFGFKNLNAGAMENKGIEALVTVVPVRTSDFEWSLTWNFSKNKNKITDLYGDLEAIIIGNAPFNVSIAGILGEEWGQIRGTDFVYDNEGNKVVNANGLYASTPVKSLGSVLPDYNMGFRNTFTYKNLTLSALIDVQKGGKYFSTSHMWSMYSGMAAATAIDGVRENGIISTGVTGTINYNSDGSYTVTDTSQNNTVVDAQTYFSHFYSGPDAQNIFNADYIKLREVTLTYTFPSKLTGPFSGIQISAFGRNLATWGLDNKDYDPEMASTGSGNIQGLEGGNLPATRSIGMNLRLQF